jgi:hypothetical protein
MAMKQRSAVPVDIGTESRRFEAVRALSRE